MNVKAQGLLNAASYVEQVYGREALGDVLRACSPAVRDTYTSCTAINWHAVEELCEFVDVAERVILGGRKRLAEEIGAAGARANMKGMLLRFAFYWSRPEYLMKRIVGMWRQFNDEGAMELLSIDHTHARVELTGIKRPNATFCRIMTGWCTEIAKGLGAKLVTGAHGECRALGGARCTWEVRGRADSEVDKAEKAAGVQASPAAPRRTSAPPRGTP
jgi:hypothetical protein